MLMPKGHVCPVCNCGYVLYVKDVATNRTKQDLKLYTCLRCQSFWNPSGYVESEAVKHDDVRWGLGVEQRNYDAATTLVKRLSKLGVKPKRVVEIGCGIGTTLRAVRDQGIETIGFDVNSHAVEYGVKTANLDLRDELWNPQSVQGKVDLFLCISVLEHIDQPRGLLKDMCTAAQANNAALFISVPALNEILWPFLRNSNPRAPGTPFFDNDVHVVHFSSRGLQMAMTEFGCKSSQPFSGQLWSGRLARFDEGSVS